MMLTRVSLFPMAVGGGAAFVISAIVALEQWMALSPGGSHNWLSLPILVALPLALATALFLLMLPIALIGAAREPALAIAAFCLAYIAVAAAGLQVAHEIRIRAFERLAQRSNGIIAAIHAYEAKEHRPPQSLADLVPEYLEVIPGTGIGAYPHYEYDAENFARENGTSWVLYVPCSEGLLDWDVFVYHPSRQYPRKGYGGSLQRVGTWAYVHE